MKAREAEEEARKKERIAEDLSQRLLRIEADRKAREEPARKKEMEEQKKRVAAGRKSREDRKKRQRERDEAAASEQCQFKHVKLCLARWELRMAQVAKEEARERDEAASEEETKRVRKDALLRKAEKVRREILAKKRVQEEEMKREARRRVEKVAAEWKRLAEERRQRGHGLAGTSLRGRQWTYGARFGEVVDIPSVDFSEVEERQKRELGLLEHDGTHGTILERMS